MASAKRFRISRPGKNSSPAARCRGTCDDGCCVMEVLRPMPAIEAHEGDDIICYGGRLSLIRTIKGELFVVGTVADVRRSDPAGNKGLNLGGFSSGCSVFAPEIHVFGDLSCTAESLGLSPCHAATGVKLELIR